MKFTPNYTVSYQGEFHKAGIPFEIEEKDIQEMSNHGLVSEHIFAVKNKEKPIEQQNRTEEESSKKGRPRK